MQQAGPAAQGLAYGGIRKTTDQNIGTLSSAWVPIAGYQTNVASSPSGVVTDLANGTVQILKPGAYTVVVNLEATYTSDNNSSRTATVRLFNITDNVPVPDSSWELYAGAYTPGFSSGISTITPVSYAGRVYRVDITGGTDAFAAFTIKQATFIVCSIGSVS